MAKLSKVEQELADYYYICKTQKKQLETQLKIETEKIQARINDLNELIFDIESILGKGDIKPVYEHFEKFERVQGVEQ